MTPGARLTAVCELAQNIRDHGGAADAAASAYFRARRYIGSKDRSYIAERLFTLLRRQARLNWWINRTLERGETAPPPAIRHQIIADLVLSEDWTIEQLDEAFDGGQHRPDKLSRAERTLALALTNQKLTHRDQPSWVRHECPEWLEPTLRDLLGSDAELDALNDGAPLDLRVNPLLADRPTALARLTEAGIKAQATGLSPLGIRVQGRPPLGTLAAFQEGLVEVQDEGSQLVALLVGAKPEHNVIDYCAGAGGKTLALAASMGNRGRLIAADISAARLDRAVRRLRRAGVHNVERRALTADNRSWFKRQAGRFDRVLVDAPCSGTGTWRRNPDMKWKIGQQDLDELSQLQRQVLGDASRLVKIGGRLVYATCSLLPQENEAVIADFLANHSDFRRVPVPDIWQEVIGTPCPVDGPDLRLTPARHGTDGFFAAILDRVAP